MLEGCGRGKVRAESEEHIGYFMLIVALGHYHKVDRAKLLVH